MNLYMVRHGQTAASRENRFSGSSDPPLTAVGEAMAEAFARAYASVTWDAICTSPMLRTRQTAAPLCRLTGVAATVEAGLREIDYGEWEGLRQDEVQQRWPDAYEYWAHDVASRGTPGGETAFHVAARAMRVVEAIRSRYEHGNVLLVSHKATLRVITCALLGLDVRLFRQRIAQPVAAVTMFRAHGWVSPTGNLWRPFASVRGTQESRRHVTGSRLSGNCADHDLSFMLPRDDRLVSQCDERRKTSATK